MTLEPPDNPDSPTPAEEQLAAWLDEYDASLKSNSEVAAPRPESLSPEARLRLRRAQTCLYLLNQARPSPPKNGAPAPSLTEQALLEVVLDEMRLRRSLGHAPRLSEYVQRFPSFAERLRDQLHALDNTPAPERTAPSSAAPLPPARVPGFEILEEIGRGGMGVVYKAWQVRLKRQVALKMIRAGTLPDAQALERFRREAETIARLQHPNIVQIYEVGETNEGGAAIPFFVLEYVEGGSLDKRLGGTPLPPDQAASLTESLARAIHAAHETGIVHRDLKPANVLLKAEGGRQKADKEKVFLPSAFCPKIADFGLAKQLDGDAGQTSTGAIVGTPSYMAPEQARGVSSVPAGQGGVGPAVDVYALGAILYELLTGRPPFKAAASVETLMLVLQEDAVPPRRLQPRLPRDLEVICLKCLEKQSTRRYASALDLAEDLRRFLAHEPIQARPSGRIERVWRWCRRKPLAAALVFVSLVAALSLPVAITGALYNSQLTEAHRKLEELNYFHRIGLAQSEWREARVARVEELLAECPPHLRQWEWHYLKRLCKPNVVTLPHGGPLLSVALSPDGSRIAAAGEDQIATLWDAGTAKKLRTFEGHTGSIYGVQLSSDGKRLLTASSDKTVKLWDMVTGKELVVFGGHTNGVRTALFGPGDKWVASACKDGHVKVWDAQTGRVVHDLEGVKNHHCCLALSSDGTRLAYGVTAIRIWDLKTGTLTSTLPGYGSAVRGLGFNKADDRLAVATEDGLARVCDPANGNVLMTLKGHSGIAYRVIFSADGQRLATASLDSTVRIWDAASGKQINHLQGHTGRVYGIAFTPDGKQMISAGTDQSVRIWDLEVAQESRVFANLGHAMSVAWSPDGLRLAATGAGNAVSIWEFDSDRLVGSLPADELRNTEVAFSADGKWIACATWSGTVYLWDANTFKLVHSLRGHEGQMFRAVFSADSQKLATGGHDKTARIWDVVRGKELLCYRDHSHDVQALAFSPDGEWVVSSGEDQTIKKWHPVTGQTAWSKEEKVRVVRAVAWSHDGKQVASANSDGIIKILDSGTGKLIRQLKGHTHGLNSLSWTTDGRRLASAGADGAILIWQVQTGQQALKLAHPGNVVSVAWSPDNRRLASADKQGYIRIWDGTSQRD